MRTPAVRDRVGGVFKTYDEKNVHQGCPRGRLWSALDPNYDVTEKLQTFSFTVADNAGGGGVER